MTTCTFEQQGSVATVTLRAGSGNALCETLLDDLDRCLENAEAPAVTSLVLTGTGTSFCVGLDLVRFHGCEERVIEAFVAHFSRTLRHLFGLEKPVVVALNGHASAGGAVLLLTGDYRIGKRDGGARVAFGEVALGLPLPHVPELVVRQALADHAQRRVLLTGRALEMPQAVELGLVDELVPASELLAAAWERARALGAFPPGFATTKRALRGETLERMATALHERETDFLAAWSSAPTQKAIGELKARLLARRASAS
jgi:enoyl-CoA hydratase